MMSGSDSSYSERCTKSYSTRRALDSVSVAARALYSVSDKFIFKIDFILVYTMAYTSMAGLTASGLERASALCTLSASRDLHINTNGIKKL